MATKQLVIFTINNEEFGIDIGQVGSIERPLDIYKIPNTPEYVEGLVNLRGNVHTVYNLRRRFDMPGKDMDESTKIIMATTESAVVGLIVDEVKEISRVEDKDLEGAPKTTADSDRRFVSGVAKAGERIILLLDLEAVLA